MDDDCILWQGRIDKKGYGRLGGGRSAHRIAWERVNGPIPFGLTIDHLCFVPACVNPSHLRLLTHEANSGNQRSAYKTHCVNGHEFTPENTYTRPRQGEGKRQCRACNRESVRRYKARRRMKAAAA